MSADGLERAIVTGANSGLGYDTCKKLAQRGVPHVTLVCRSQAKADAAIAQLVEETGKPRAVFSVLVMDTSDIAGCRAAAESVADPVNAVVLNAGGIVGGPGPTPEGVTGMFAINVLGHAQFVETLLARSMIAANGAVMFAGSEGARGIPKMQFPRPSGLEASADNMDGWITGSAYKKFDAQLAYGYDKLVGALYIAALARRHPAVYFVTVSPGATAGTSAAKNSDMNCCMRNCFLCCIPILKCCGMFQGLSEGSERYMRAVSEREFRDEYASGTFVASAKGAVGPLCDQAVIWDIFAKPEYHEAAYQAVHRHLP